jgi:hypothetical protein
MTLRGPLGLMLLLCACQSAGEPTAPRRRLTPTEEKRITAELVDALDRCGDRDHEPYADGIALLSVGATGRVLSVRLLPDTLEHRPWSDCATAAAAKAVFPQTGGDFDFQVRVLRGHGPQY